MTFKNDTSVIRKMSTTSNLLAAYQSAMFFGIIALPDKG